MANALPEVSRPAGIEPQPLPARLLWLMAVACAFCVANIYYNQPLLGVFADQFHVPPWKAGLVATASQVGYGLGLLFFLPLGDLLERRRLIVSLICVCALSLVCVAAAPNLPVLIIGNLAVGVCSIGAQILIPLATDLGSATQRGKIVGVLMSGVLGGILLARVFAGVMADYFGWRSVYFVAAVFMLILGLMLRVSLPNRAPTVTMPYGRLMHSLLGLFRTQRVLRSASAVSALSFAGFVAFWTTLSFFLAERFHLGPSTAGLFGIIGLIGAAGAPWAGRLSDRKGFGFTLKIALLFSAVAFLCMDIFPTIAGLVVGVLLMDLGVQSVQVAAQAEVLSLQPEARSRINTLYMVGRFGGGAAGSALGSLAWSIWKWPGVCACCFGLTLLAMLIDFVSHRGGKASG